MKDKSYLMLWLALTNSNRRYGIFSATQQLAKDKTKYLLSVYERIPAELREFLPEVTKYTATCIEFDNGSGIILGKATPGNVRGYTFNSIYVDDFCFEISEDFLQCVLPTIMAKPDSKFYRFGEDTK